jgi:flagellar assembly factor FliW
MPEMLTRDFGPVDYSPEEVFDFPLGLPGFPDCRRFLTLRPQPEEALVVLQCVDRPEIAFLTLPADVLLAGYQLRMVEQDWLVLGSPTAGRHVLVMLTLPEHGPATANLLGPVVLNPAARRGVQAIRDDHRYSAAEPLEALLGQMNQPARTAERQQEAVCS